MPSSLLDLATSVWDEERFDLLEGRLSIALPRHARVEPRVVAGRTPRADEETRLVVRHAVALRQRARRSVPAADLGTFDERFVVLAHEYGVWRPDLATIGPSPMDGGSIVSRETIGGLVLTVVEPARAMSSDGETMVLDVLLHVPDLTLVRVQLRCLLASPIDRDRATTLARRAMAGTRVGTKTRPESVARTHTWELHLAAPAVPLHLDARAARVQLEIGEPGVVEHKSLQERCGVMHRLDLTGGALEIGIGAPPEPCCRAAGAERWTGTRARVLGRDVWWHRWRRGSSFLPGGDAAHHAELVDDFPWSDHAGDQIHILVSARDEPALAAIVQVAESMRVVPRSAPPREDGGDSGDGDSGDG